MLIFMVLSNLLLTAALVGIAGAAYVKLVLRAPKPATEEQEEARLDGLPTSGRRVPHRDIGLTRPIHHERVTGPMTGLVTTIATGTTMGYYVPKDDPNAEPCVALYYDGNHNDRGIIPADSYLIIGSGSVVHGFEFRKLYEPANNIAVLMRTAMKTPTRPRAQIITSNQPTPKLTEEEERKLAEEYGLVDDAPAAVNGRATA